MKNTQEYIKDQATEHESLYINEHLTGYNYPVVSFKSAGGLNAHVFVIKVTDMELKTTHTTLGFPAIRKMKLPSIQGKFAVVKDHASRLNDWNELAKNGELFWQPLKDEPHPTKKSSFPGVFHVCPKNGTKISYLDECSSLKIMNPADQGQGGGMQMGF